MTIDQNEIEDLKNIFTEVQDIGYRCYIGYDPEDERVSMDNPLSSMSSIDYSVFTKEICILIRKPTLDPINYEEVIDPLIEVFDRLKDIYDFRLRFELAIPARGLLLDMVGILKIDLNILMSFLRLLV